MAFQSEVGSGTKRATDTNTTPGAFAIPTTHDWLTKRVNWMCSKHADTAVLNAAGTGYTVGDLLTLTHASAHFDVVIEVLTITGGGGTGPVGTFRINNSGAFALQVASAVVVAGGSGYQVGDILELQAGSARVPAKAEVLTLSGSAVATVGIIEGGGVYSTTAGAAGATVGVGNADPTLTYAGDDACTLTVTDTAIISTLTNLAVTGGTGSSCTIDITLAETGWAVDGRNTNNTVINSINNEKQVVLVGDATGITNKPYIWYRTFTETITLNTHSGIAAGGLIAHNSALDLSAHSPISPGLSGETAMNATMANSPTLPDSGAGHGDVDLWFAADDTHFREVAQIDDAAATSDAGIYVHHYAGYLDRIGTETENPYPLYIFGSQRDPTSPASTSNSNITGLVEQRCGSGGCSYLYDAPNGVFQQFRNADGLASPGTEIYGVTPAGNPRINDGTSDADFIVKDVLENERAMSIFGSDNGTNVSDRKIFNHGDRTTPWRLMRWIPGTVDLPFLWPLTVYIKMAAAADPEDRLVGNIKGCHWIPSDNGSGARISNFSEDYVTVGSTRYLVFHNTNETTPNQYMAFEMNV